jgi:hypothetical protein
MDTAWSPEAGFTLTSRVLDCCNATVSLESLGSDPACAFGSFALVVTDTKNTYSDDELDAMMKELQAMLKCRLHRVDAHY